MLPSARCSPMDFGEITKQTPNPSGFAQALVFLRRGFCSGPRQHCLFQPGWVWERFPPPLPLHLTQKMFENPRLLPSPASPALGDRRLKEKQTKASLCSGELMGHEAATPPLVLLPSWESGLSPLSAAAPGTFQPSLAWLSHPSQGWGCFYQLSKLQNTSQPSAVPLVCAFTAGL